MKKDKEWAKAWKVSPERIEAFRQELIRARETGAYIVYHTNIEDMDADEIKLAYSRMRDYISDVNTHH